jgi:hypothetical protein
MTDSTTLEALAEASRPGRSAPSKRMLVIVNPYATTMSDRLKGLVIYALQGRYEVEAVDTQRQGHATELARRRARATTWSSRSGGTARSTRSSTVWRAPGRR